MQARPSLAVAALEKHSDADFWKQWPVAALKLMCRGTFCSGLSFGLLRLVLLGVYQSRCNDPEVLYPPPWLALVQRKLLKDRIDGQSASQTGF